MDGTKKVINQKAAETAAFGGSQNNPSNPSLTVDCSIANQQNLSSTTTVDNSGSAGAAGNCTPETLLSKKGSDYPSPSTSSSYQSSGKQVKTGKILVFVNLGYSKLDDETSQLAQNSDSSTTNAWSVNQQSGKVNVIFFGDLNLNGNKILDVGKITGYLGKWSIDEEGTLMAVRVITNELIAKTAKVETLCIGSTCITEAELLQLLGKTPQSNNSSLITDNSTTINEQPLIIDSQPETSTASSTTATTTEPILEPVVMEDTATSTNLITDH